MFRLVLQRHQSAVFHGLRQVCMGEGTMAKIQSNVEIKASISDTDRLKSLALGLTDEKRFDTLKQVDTFFNCHRGRLKLRQTVNQPSSPAQLVYYERADLEGPKVSNYSITLIDDAESLKRTLGMSLGVRGIVKKTRTLIMVGQTRVHIDEVEDLGNFMELEVVLRDGQSQEEGMTIADDLMDKLSIHQSNLISGAYMDMLEL
ncbi:adenylate cyclase CyaB-like [Diadema setosum]|uniref:adenylate cyclase CyaB-like n=1 Tax=Diadema setosum TaxID=31175 RepID=UPI003B3BB240